MKTRAATLLATALIALFCCGCGGTQQVESPSPAEENVVESVETKEQAEDQAEEQEEAVEEADSTISNDDVAAALLQGLENRWKAADNAPESYTSAAEVQKTITSFVDLELEALAGVSDGEYEDAETGEMIKAYIDALNAQKDQLKDIAVHYTLSNYNFGVIGDNKRLPTLQGLVEKLKISFGDYQQVYDDLIGSATLQGRDVIEDVFAVTECRGFEHVLDDYSRCELKVANMTNMSFDSVWIRARFYDSEGVQIYEASSNQQNVEPDGIFWLEFGCSSSEVPSSIKVVSYEIAQKDPTGEYDYTIMDDCTVVTQASFDLQ